ncbi:hypothetical protein [Kamptonema formosum]|uniref:hypothetical protein n=1 Tax=Kamptonema formosum TaxID=331992 RepID=UPI0012DBDE00|nr:hypothetical protein [Oscillatoria sp. PCC 10802]
MAQPAAGGVKLLPAALCWLGGRLGRASGALGAGAGPASAGGRLGSGAGGASELPQKILPNR